MRIRRLPGQSLAEVRETIASRLGGECVARGRSKLVASLTARYRPETVCGERIRLPNCSNGPDHQPVFLPFSSRPDSPTAALHSS